MEDLNVPQVFKIGGYIVYFWVNENDPLEPIHVHVAEGKPAKNGTKIWLTKAGGCILQNNNSNRIYENSPARNRAGLRSYKCG